MIMKQKGDAFAHITSDILDMVRGVLAESAKHVYSTSRVYAAHNAFFQRQDKPQTCPSCLRNRVRELKQGLADFAATPPPYEPEPAPEAEPKKPSPRKTAPRKTAKDFV